MTKFTTEVASAQGRDRLPKNGKKGKKDNSTESGIRLSFRLVLEPTTVFDSSLQLKAMTAPPRLLCDQDNLKKVMTFMFFIAESSGCFIYLHLDPVEIASSCT